MAMLSRSKPVRVPGTAIFLTSDPDVVMTTVLGSCVAVCLRDNTTQDLVDDIEQLRRHLRLDHYRRARREP